MLVTVEVSGVWQGTAIAEFPLELTLEQRGAAVSGDAWYRATKVLIQGIVRGDVLSFLDAFGRIRGEATVTGDAVQGRGWTDLAPPFIGTFRLRPSRHTEGQSR